MTKVTTAFSLNHRAVQHIRRGELDLAVATLSQALSITKECYRLEVLEESSSSTVSCGANCGLVGGCFLQRQHTQQDHQQSKHSDSNHPHPPSSSSSSVQEDYEMYTTTTTTIDLSRNNSSFSSTFGYVYQQPIETKLEVATILQFQCIVIIFNLALAFHLKGIQQCSSSIVGATGRHYQKQERPTWEAAAAQQDDDEQYYQQQQQKPAVAPAEVSAGHFQDALNLYELCLELIHSERIETGLLFTMAIVNNAGHVCSMLHEKDEKANYFFRQLLSLQMLYIEHYKSLSIMDYRWGGGHDHEDYDSSRIDGLILDGFLQNTSYLILKDSYYSSAA